MRRSHRTTTLVVPLLALGLVVVACDPGADATPEPSPAPVTTEAATVAPEVTEAPAPDPPPTEAPASEAPPTEPPATEAPPTEPPATEPPATEPPSTPEPTEAPATEAPAAVAPAAVAEATDPATTEEPTPSDPPPFELGDQVVGTSVISGPDLIAQLDPNVPSQAANLAEIEALLEAADAGPDQLTLFNGVSADGTAFIGGLRLDRADINAARAAYIESTYDNLVEPRVEEGEVAGKPVALIHDDALPDEPPLVIYAKVPVVWLISGPPESVEAVLSSLP